MNARNIYGDEPNALDIVDEAIALVRAARSEAYQLTIAEAIEIMKIQRLDKLTEHVRILGGRVDVLSNVIHGDY